MICRRSGIASFDNRTELDTDLLKRACLDAVAGWRLDHAEVRIRYSRGADFSGSCYYATSRIYVNLGRHVTFPYRMGTNIAKARSNDRYWWRPIYTLELADAYQLVLFVFLHECFHLLVKRAARNTRRKESMCDRFAGRVLVDRYGVSVLDEKGRPVSRESWDFQNLDRFIAAARRPDAARAGFRDPRQCATLWHSGGHKSSMSGLERRPVFDDGVLNDIHSVP